VKVLLRKLQAKEAATQTLVPAPALQILLRAAI
jgi:hypothetical protein